VPAQRQSRRGSDVVAEAGVFVSRDTDVSTAERLTWLTRGAVGLRREGQPGIASNDEWRSSVGEIPRTARQAREKWAESEKPAWCAAVVAVLP